MMRKTTLLLAITLACVCAYAYKVTVTTEPTTLVPDFTTDDSSIVWSNGLVVAQGDYVVNTNSPARVYWAISGGTTTNMPTVATGVETNTDAVSWLYITRQYRESQRENAVVFADESTKVYYVLGATPTTGDSILDAMRPARGFPGEQAEVVGIVESGTASVNVEIKR